MTTPTYQPPMSAGIQLCAGCGTASYNTLCTNCTAKLSTPTDNSTPTKLTTLLVVALIIMIICALAITTTSIKLILTT